MITVGLKNLTGSGDTLKLEDANGTTLATATTGATNFDLAISNFSSLIIGAF